MVYDHMLLPSVIFYFLGQCNRDARRKLVRMRGYRIRRAWWRSWGGVCCEPSLCTIAGHGRKCGTSPVHRLTLTPHVCGRPCEHWVGATIGNYSGNSRRRASAPLRRASAIENSLGKAAAITSAGAAAQSDRKRGYDARGIQQNATNT
jgi:hypothetical protein